MFIKKNLFTLLLFLSPLFVFSQGIGNSPFSSFGLGDFQYYYGTTRHLGMGNTGAAMRHPYFINQINPAYYGNFAKQRLDSTVKFEGAFNTVFRGVQSSEDRNQTIGGNIAYFSFSVPMSKRWGMGLGIRPYVAKDHNFSYVAPVVGNPSMDARHVLKGEGSLTELYMGHGVGITRFLNLGMQSSFIFGSLYNTSLSQLITDPSSPDAENYHGIRTQSTYNAFAFRPALATRFELKTLRDDKVQLKIQVVRNKIAIVETFSTQKENDYKREIDDINDRIKRLPKDSLYARKKTQLEREEKIYQDSIVYNKKHYDNRLMELNKELRELTHQDFRAEVKAIKDSMMAADPSLTAAQFKKYKNVHYRYSKNIFLNAGLTYDFYSDVRSKLYTEVLTVMTGSLIEKIDTVMSESVASAKFPPAVRFGISADRPGRWAIGADFGYTWWSSFTNSNGSSGLENTYSVSLGGEFTPSTRKPLRSKTYRAGLNYSQLPFSIDNTRINDVSFSLGVSVPMGTRSMTAPILPRINAALVVGQRGMLQDNMIRDRYVKLQLSVLINDGWFNRYKIR